MRTTQTLPRDEHQSASGFDAGMRAYRDGRPPSPMEGADWHCGYEYARNLARWDCGATVLAVVIVTSVVIGAIVWGGFL